MTVPIHQHLLVRAHSFETTTDESKLKDFLTVLYKPTNSLYRRYTAFNESFRVTNSHLYLLLLVQFTIAIICQLNFILNIESLQSLTKPYKVIKRQIDCIFVNTFFVNFNPELIKVLFKPKSDSPFHIMTPKRNSASFYSYLFTRELCKNAKRKLAKRILLMKFNFSLPLLFGKKAS